MAWRAQYRKAGRSGLDQPQMGNPGFVNGKQCLGVRVYPGREDSVGVSLRSQGKASKLTSLDAWQMKSIYE